MGKRLSGLIIGLSCCICFLYGCSQRKASLEETFAVVNNMRTQVTNDGIFYLDGYTEMMKFYDFNLARSIPICDRPNCKHDSSACNAYLSQGFMSGMGCYRDRLYYYDNMSPGVPFYQCDKNGSNRKELAKLNGEGVYDNFKVELPMFFVEDEALFRISFSNFLTEPVTRKDGTVISEEYFWTFGKINLSSGVFEILKEPKALDVSEWIDTEGYMEGSVFYSISDGNHWTEYRFDIENRKESILSAPNAEQMGFLGMIYDMQKVIYKTETEGLCEVYAYDMQTGETESVYQKKKEKGKELHMSMYGNKLFYCVNEEGKGNIEGEEYGVYDINAEEEKLIMEEEFTYAPNTAETKDWYVGVTEEGTVCIPKEAYEKKDWSRVQVIGSF